MRCETCNNHGAVRCSATWSMTVANVVVGTAFFCSSQCVPSAELTSVASKMKHPHSLVAWRTAFFAMHSMPLRALSKRISHPARAHAACPPDTSGSEAHPRVSAVDPWHRELSRIVAAVKRGMAGVALGILTDGYRKLARVDANLNGEVPPGDDAEFLIALGATSVSRSGPMRARERGRNGFVTQVALTREQLQDLRDVADKLLTRPA